MFLGRPTVVVLTSSMVAEHSCVSMGAQTATLSDQAEINYAFMITMSDEEEEYDSFALNHRRPMRTHDAPTVFSQITTKIPPSYDGRHSWFAYEEAIDDWADITELEVQKHGAALRNRLEGEAAVQKHLT